MNPNELTQFGCADGKYLCVCTICNCDYIGDKRSILCWDCATRKLVDLKQVQIDNLIQEVDRHKKERANAFVAINNAHPPICGGTTLDGAVIRLLELIAEHDGHTKNMATNWQAVYANLEAQLIQANLDIVRQSKTIESQERQLDQLVGIQCHVPEPGGWVCGYVRDAKMMQNGLQTYIDMHNADGSPNTCEWAVKLLEQCNKPHDV